MEQYYPPMFYIIEV